MAEAGGSLDVRLIPLRRRHLRSVLNIESQVYPRPWSLSLFMSELQMRATRHYVAAWVGGKLVGYAGMMTIVDEAHVTNIAVDPEWQRHQIGTRLLANLVRSARDRGCRQVTLEVRVSNRPAQELYRLFGFEVEGLRKNYYTDLGEDALIMWARSIDTAAYEDRLGTIEASVGGSTSDYTREGSRR